MKSSSAPAPSICGLANTTTRSPLDIGVASSRDSSIRACMQPLTDTTSRHAYVRRTAFMRSSPFLRLRDVVGRGQYATLQHLPFVTMDNTPWFPFTPGNPDSTVHEYAPE